MKDHHHVKPNTQTQYCLFPYGCRHVFFHCRTYYFLRLKRSPVNCSPTYTARCFPTHYVSVNQHVIYGQNIVRYIITLLSSQNSIFPVSLGQRLILSTEALHLPSDNRQFHQVTLTRYLLNCIFKADHNLLPNMCSSQNIRYFLISLIPTRSRSIYNLVKTITVLICLILYKLLEYNRGGQNM